MVSQLGVGSLNVRRTPQGPRLSLSLTFMGRPVATVMLNADLRFTDRQAVPLLPDSPAPPALSAADRQELSRQIRELVASGLATATGPHVRVALLSSGAPVTDLRFDRASGILLAEPPEKRKDDPRSGKK